MKDCVVFIAAESIPNTEPLRQRSPRCIATVNLVIHKQVKRIVACLDDFDHSPLMSPCILSSAAHSSGASRVFIIVSVWSCRASLCGGTRPRRCCAYGGIRLRHSAAKAPSFWGAVSAPVRLPLAEVRSRSGQALKSCPDTNRSYACAGTACGSPSRSCRDLTSGKGSQMWGTRLALFILRCKPISYCRFKRLDVDILQGFKPNAISGHAGVA